MNSELHLLLHEGNLLVHQLADAHDVGDEAALRALEGAQQRVGKGQRSRGGPPGAAAAP